MAGKATEPMDFRAGSGGVVGSTSTRLTFGGHGLDTFLSWASFVGGKQIERVQAMAKTELKSDAASFTLRAAAILGVIYGFGFLLMPDSLFHLSGDPGVPSNPGWVRWAGAFVLGIAIGPWLASEGWVKEQPFIAGLAAAYTLSGLALLYSVVSGEYAGAAWFIWMPIVILAVLTPIMWWLAIKD